MSGQGVKSGMLVECETDDCNVIVFGSGYCVACEQASHQPRTYPVGRPFRLTATS